MRWCRSLLILITFLLFKLADVVAISICESVTCSTSITADDCQTGEILVAGQHLNGCCPGCKGGLEFKSPCNQSNDECAPGLQCKTYENQPSCRWNENTCFYLNYLRQDEVEWRPSCNLDGTYAPVQCRGDRPSGRCYCFSETGNRIFGWDWWRDADDMTCACSRQRAKLEAGGRTDVTLHCQRNGNYEELQCDSGACWCADIKTGQPRYDTVVVPESLWELLPCYNSTIYGDSYLRQCESASFAQRAIRAQLSRRGTDTTFNNIQCDYDGTYGTYEIINGLAYCTWRDGTKIGGFQSPSNTVSGMNCICARDQKLYNTEGLAHSLQCGGNGNYYTKQDINGDLFCVDRDGYTVRNNVTLYEECEKYIYYSAVMQ